MQPHNPATTRSVLTLFNSLLQLSHSDKLRAVHLLLREIALEEGIHLDEYFPQAETSALDALFTSLDQGRNEKPVGCLRREEIYDRKLFHRY